MTRSHDPAGLKRITRPRLYEQVAQQITQWVSENGLRAGDRLPPERELAVRLGVSRATVSQALVALEVLGVLTVRHGDGAVLVELTGPSKVIPALQSHAARVPDILDARDALEPKLAALAAERRSEHDLQEIDAAIAAMQRDIEQGGRGVEGDERFHAAVTKAGQSSLLEKMMDEMSDLILETRIESLAQPGRPNASLKGHRAIAEAIRRSDPEEAARAMRDHITLVSNVEWLRED
jgi:GntR family transcriptional regulator, transcriptional repressor for pyruvate dehydrogenase complex